MKLDRLQLAAGCLFAACIALSTIHPWGNPRAEERSDAPLLQASQAPPAVRALLAAKCGDCHSERTHYPIYAHIAPVSWMIERDIHNARSRMNLTQWDVMNVESRISVLTRMASVVRTDQMPPRSYVMLHPGARLSPEEAQQIYGWAKAERKRIRQDASQAFNQPAVSSDTEKP